MPRILVLFLVVAASQALSSENKCPDTASVVESLKTLKGRDLYTYLGSVQSRLGGCDVDDGSIDAYVTELRRIENEDTYEKVIPPQSPKGAEHVELNSTAAKALISYLKCRKAVNAMHTMTVAERVIRIMDTLEGVIAPGEDKGCLEGELRRTGQEALPFIVDRAPTTGYRLQWYVALVAGIGGEGSIKFLTRVFQERTNEPWVRCDALKAVANTAGTKVIPEVIEQLRDETIENGSRCASQRMFGESDHGPCSYQSFPLRTCAAAALTQMTAKNWGPIFNQEYRTWKAWRESQNPDKFHPFMLARNEADMKELALVLLNRALEYRTGPWNSPCQESEATMVGRQLGELGHFGVSVLVEYFQSRAPSLKREAALENLKEWIGSVLETIGTPEARAAQEVIYAFPLPESPP